MQTRHCQHAYKLTMRVFLADLHSKIKDERGKEKYLQMRAKLAELAPNMLLDSDTGCNERL